MRAVSGRAAVLSVLALSFGWCHVASAASFGEQLRLRALSKDPNEKAAAISRLASQDLLDPVQLLQLAAELRSRDSTVQSTATRSFASTLECRAHYRLREDVAARQACDEAVRLGREDPHSTALIVALRLSGYRLSESGDTQAAVTMLREAQRLARQSGDTYDDAMALNTLGITASNIGAFNESAQLYSSALDLARAANWTDLVAIVSVNLGMLYNSRGEPEAARERLQEGLRAANAVENHQLVAVAKTAVAESLLLQEDHSAARQAVAGLISAAPGTLDDRFLSESYHIAGRAALGEGKMQEAEHLLRIAYQKASSNPFRRARIANSLSDLLLGQGRLDEAEILARQTIAGAAKFKAEYLNAEFQLSKALAARGRFREAYEIRDRMIAGQRQWGVEQTAHQLVFMRASMDADLKDAEIRNLRERALSAAQQARAAEDSRKLTLSVAVAIALLLFSAWLFLRRRQDARAREQLEAEVKRRTMDLEQQQQDRRRLEAELEQRRRLESIGRLTGGIAHDYNNLMTIVRQSCDLLKRRDSLRADNGALDLLEECEQAAQVAGGISRQLVAFARKQPLKPQPIELQQYLNSVAMLLDRAAGTDRQLSVSCDPDLVVMADSGPLTTALINLVSNARDATVPGDLIKLEARRWLPAESSQHSDGAIQGRLAAFCVTDTGHGMDEEVVSQCIEPFFTTKGSASGSGLGLSMVHGLATQSGGDLLVESQKGKGTRVTLLLPLQ